MPKVSEEYKKNRRAEIIAAARECFSKNGYQKTSMSEIIAASNLSAGAIYNHFESKHEIMLAAAELDYAPFEKIKADTPWDYVLGCLKVLDAPKLRRFLLITWGEAVTDRELAAVVSTQLQTLRDLALERYRRWAIDTLGAQEEQLDAFLDSTGAAILSVLTGYTVQTQLLAGAKSEQAREAYLSYALATLDLSGE